MPYLSNFYTDYSVDSAVYDEIFKVYNDIASLITGYVQQVSDNSVVNSVETYRIIPIQYTPIDEATYDVATIVNNSIVIKQKYNVVASLTDETKQIFWDGLTNEQKADILDLAGKYILLTVKRSDVLDRPVPQIVDLEMYDDKNNKLVRDYDFMLFNNRIYLINTSISQPAENVKFCLKNIAVDLNTPQKLLGSRVKTNYTDVLTKPEYRGMTQMLMYGALGGPTIKNIRDALSSVVQMSGVKIYDKYNADKLRAGYWDSNNKDKLTDFDFLISIPNELTSDIAKLELFKNYLNIIKPSDTNFIMGILYPFKDVLNLKAKRAEENLRALQKRDLFDRIRGEELDGIAVVKVSPQDKIINGGMIYKLDVGLLFDAAIPTDMISDNNGGTEEDIYMRDSIIVKYFK